ncbi:MAG: hypothetical protein Q7T05_05875 [Dehalococcoidia bacterium]|nr:hypothetical protein [Dehalococcoidia bacterium]
MKIFLVKLGAFLQRLRRDQRGAVTIVQAAITGASVLVAGGTFAAATVTSGTDATQQAQQVVHQSIQNILSTMDLRGNVVAIASTTGSKGTVGQVQFTVGLATSGGAVDLTPPQPSPDNNGLPAPDSMNNIIISYTDRDQRVDNLYWTARSLGKNNGDNILDEGEQFLIIIGGNKVPGKNGGNLVDALASHLSTDSRFSIEVKASDGAVLVFDRRTPAAFDPVINFGY